MMKRALLAFLMAMLPSAALGAAFCATMEAVQTGFVGPPPLYNEVQMNAETFDLGDSYIGGQWTPVPAGGEPKVVAFFGQVWVKVVGGPPEHPTPNYVTRIVKNGSPADSGYTIPGTGIGAVGTFEATMIVDVEGLDLAMPGDSYRLYLYASAPTAVIDANPLHSYWCGHTVAE